jgi:hypothetical protein
MTATFFAASVPTTSSPECPGAVLRSHPGMSAYGMRVAPVTSSASLPSPEPSTMATRGWIAVFARIAATAASGSSAIRPAPLLP